MVIAKYNNNSNRIIDSMKNIREFKKQDYIDEELIIAEHAESSKRKI